VTTAGSSAQAWALAMCSIIAAVLLGLGRCDMWVGTGQRQWPGLGGTAGVRQPACGQGSAGEGAEEDEQCH
jgi:hypothetical protein